MSDVDLRIARLTLRPGDTLVVKAAHHLTRDMRECVRQAVAPHIPEGVAVLVIDPLLELSVLAREGARDAAEQARAA